MSIKNICQILLMNNFNEFSLGGIDEKISNYL